MENIGKILLKLMINIVNNFRRLIWFSCFVMGGAQASEIYGYWATPSDVGAENISLCVQEEMLSYKRERKDGSLKIIESEKQGYSRLDDVFIVPIYSGRSLYRKFVLVYREGSSVLYGQFHLYASDESYNYLPVYMEKISDSCPSD